MSDVASLELSRELYKLSGWKDTIYWWRFHKLNKLSKLYTFNEMDNDRYRFRNSPETPRFNEENEFFPAYDLGYLLRKLEASEKTIGIEYHSLEQPLSMDLKEWAGLYTASTADMPQREYPYAGVPEDAAGKLCIELFKRGILKREGV